MLSPLGDRASKRSLMDCVSPNLEALSYPGLPSSSQFCDLLALPFVGGKLTRSLKSRPIKEKAALSTLGKLLLTTVGGAQTATRRKGNETKTRLGSRGGIKR